MPVLYCVLLYQVDDIDCHIYLGSRTFIITFVIAEYSCERCKKPVLRHPSQVFGRVFCGMSCVHKWNRLVSNTRYKDWNEIRRKALDVSKYRYELCGKAYEKLNIHHKDFSGDDQQIGCNNSLENLATLCISCHVHVHHVFKKFFNREIVVVK